MSKRFTDTDKYKKPFLRGLQGAYKVLWDYLYHNCDHAGIWIKDFEIAQIYIGSDLPVNEKDALKYFNKGERRIIEFDNNKKWFIPSFIDFQYGDLNPKNKAHNSVIRILKKSKLYNKGLVRGLQRPKDKDKDKDKEMVKDKVKEIRNTIPPQIEILIMYFQEKGLTGTAGKKEAEMFFNFYESKGWMIGKNKMKDWQAAVRNWIKNMDKFNGYNKPKKITEPDTTEELIESKKQADIEYAEKLKRRGENV